MKFAVRIAGCLVCAVLALCADSKKSAREYDQGLNYEHAGQWQPALAAFTASLAAEPNAPAYLHRAKAQIALNMPEKAIEDLDEAIRLGTYAEVKLLRPFIKMTKADIAARGHVLGVDFSKTWSCYKGATLHCGTCGTCVERREAFLLAGIADPTQYSSEGALPPKPGAVA